MGCWATIANPPAGPPRSPRPASRAHDPDTRPPGDEDRTLDITTLLTRYLPRATRKASEAAGDVPLTVLGYCIGGTLAACYTALYPEKPVRVRNLVLFTTPIDFAEAGKFGIMTA